MNKGLKRRVLTALFAVLACSFLVGSFTVSAAGNYLPEDFFAGEGGTPIVVEDWETAATQGTYVFLEGTEQGSDVSIKYKDAFDVAALGNAVTFQVLPSKDGASGGVSDFDAVQVILKDSVDESEVISNQPHDGVCGAYGRDLSCF